MVAIQKRRDSLLKKKNFRELSIRENVITTPIADIDEYNVIEKLELSDDMQKLDSIYSIYKVLSQKDKQYFKQELENIINQGFLKEEITKDLSNNQTLSDKLSKSLSLSLSFIQQFIGAAEERISALKTYAREVSNNKLSEEVLDTRQKSFVDIESLNSKISKLEQCLKTALESRLINDPLLVRIQSKREAINRDRSNRSIKKSGEAIDSSILTSNNIKIPKADCVNIINFLSYLNKSGAVFFGENDKNEQIYRSSGKIPYFKMLRIKNYGLSQEQFKFIYKDFKVRSGFLLNYYQILGLDSKNVDDEIVNKTCESMLGAIDEFAKILNIDISDSPKENENIVNSTNYQMGLLLDAGYKKPKFAVEESVTQIKGVLLELKDKVNNAQKILSSNELRGKYNQRINLFSQDNSKKDINKIFKKIAIKIQRTISLLRSSKKVRIKYNDERFLSKLKFYNQQNMSWVQAYKAKELLYPSPKSLSKQAESNDVRAEAAFKLMYDRKQENKYYFLTLIPLLNKNSVLGISHDVVREKVNDSIKLTFDTGGVKFNFDKKSVIDNLIGDFIARGLLPHKTGFNYYQMLDLPETASNEEIKKRVDLTLDAIDAINTLNEKGFSQANVREQFNLASVQIRNAAEILGNERLRHEYNSRLIQFDKSINLSQKKSLSPLNRKSYLKRFEVPEGVKEQVATLNDNSARFKFFEFSEDTKRRVGELFTDRTDAKNANFSLGISSDDGKNLIGVKRLKLERVYYTSNSDFTILNSKIDNKDFYIKADDELVNDFINDTLARYSLNSEELGITAYQALDLSDKISLADILESTIRERGQRTQDALRAIITDLGPDHKLLIYLKYALHNVSNSVNILVDSDKTRLQKQLEASSQKQNETQTLFKQLESNDRAFSEIAKDKVKKLFDDRAEGKDTNFLLGISSDVGQNLEIVKRLRFNKGSKIDKSDDAASDNEKTYCIEKVDDSLIKDFINDTLARFSPHSDELGITAYQALDLSSENVSADQIKRRAILVQDALNEVMKSLGRKHKLLPSLKFALLKISDSVDILLNNDKTRLQNQLENSSKKSNETQAVFQEIDSFNSSIDNSVEQKQLKETSQKNPNDDFLSEKSLNLPSTQKIDETNLQIAIDSELKNHETQDKKQDEKLIISLEDLGTNLGALSEESSDHDVNLKTSVESKKNNQGEKTDVDIQDLQKHFNNVLSGESSDYDQKSQSVQTLDEVVDLNSAITEKQNLEGKQKRPESLPSTMLSELQILSIRETPLRLRQRG